MPRLRWSAKLPNGWMHILSASTASDDATRTRANDGGQPFLLICCRALICVLFHRRGVVVRWLAGTKVRAWTLMSNCKQIMFPYLEAAECTFTSPQHRSGLHRRCARVLQELIYFTPFAVACDLVLKLISNLLVDTTAIDELLPVGMGMLPACGR